MSTSSKNLAKSSQYSATSRKRAAMRAQATLMGWEPLDVLGAYRDGGNLIVVLRDETRIVASVTAQADRPTPDADPVDEVGARRASKSSESAPKPKKVYPPKSWEPGTWNMVVGNLRAQDYTKDEARAEISKATKLSAQQVKHALAVIDAVPDTPDWYDHVPLAES